MSDNIKSIAGTGKKPQTKYNRWNDEITKGEKALEKWHLRGAYISKRYLDERDTDVDDRKFNLFTANTEIMMSSLYAKIPKVDVSRRFEQHMDDTARISAMMLENCIKQDLEDPCSNFDQVMRYAVQDRLIDGLGMAWLRVETETESKTLPQELDPLTNEVIREESTYDEVTHQEVPIDFVHWNDVLWSPCRTWEERRWVARRVYLDYDGLEARFGQEIANQIPLKQQDDQTYNQITSSTEQQQEKACIYEIWDRVAKEVIWFSKDYKELLDEKEDPLHLDDFEPFPKPMFATMTTDACVPVPDFVILQDQYNEMDQVNNRISLLVQACKVVGVYDQTATGVARMLQEGSDNTLIPVDGWAMFAEKGGVKGVIDWLPLEVVVQALEKLRQAREDIKGQIYEITGISDIVRGDTKASETLGAQTLKAQFAGVRIQSKQEEVARFAQDILRIKGELICKHFTVAQITKMSGIEYYPDFLQNPQGVQQAIQLLKSDHETFEWRAKVQADSLAQENSAVNKKDKVEFTNAMATFLQSAATTMKAIPESAPIIFESLKFSISGFKGARELEGVIDHTLKVIMDKIQNPPASPPNPAVEKAKVDMQLAQQDHQLESQGKQQDFQIAQAEAQADLSLKQQEAQMEVRKFMMEMQQSQQEFAQLMRQNQEQFLQTIAQNAALGRQKLDLAEAQAVAKASSTLPNSKE